MASTQTIYGGERKPQATGGGEGGWSSDTEEQKGGKEGPYVCFCLLDMALTSSVWRQV